MNATETETASADRIAAGGIYRLLVVFAPEETDVGYSRVLDQHALTIGREASDASTLQLQHARVSRRHARIEAEGSDRFLITDLESRNGTYVNGRRIASASIGPGDVIRIGSTLLLLQHLDARACQLMLQPRHDPGELVGNGHTMAQVHADIAAAPTTAPTLIIGETGVGKELVARAVHQQCGRQGPLVPVNCSALPDHLVESELFGHVRGAFTGAEGRKGLFQQAEKGTIFLDEIGEVPTDVQVKLLRALALGEVRPVGADRERIVEVGVVAATNVELEEAVEAGRFRADLYARLMAHVIRVPPLRDRKEDVLVLAHHFLDGSEVRFSPDAAEALLVHSWPYNVRELEQVMAPLRERALALRRLELGDLPERLRSPLAERIEAVSPTAALPTSLLGIRRDSKPDAKELLAVLEAHDGNVAGVAAFFGKDRRQIYRWADGLGLDLARLRERIQDES
ncbi:MAG: sigma 54-interacting transcriptional regulator [Myxococcales bacterium]|nr:sigma 54-interacting transcriptional regulator [Myxococcales bacterium]